jgi:peptidoglycan/LPS O-acetylase OafA/YrhL
LGICVVGVILVSPIGRLPASLRPWLSLGLAALILLLLALVYVVLPMIQPGLPLPPETVFSAITILCGFGLGFGLYALYRKTSPLAALLISGLLGLSLCFSLLAR